MCPTRRGTPSRHPDDLAGVSSETAALHIGRQRISGESGMLSPDSKQTWSAQESARPDGANDDPGPHEPLQLYELPRRELPMRQPSRDFGQRAGCTAACLRVRGAVRVRRRRTRLRVPLKACGWPAGGAALAGVDLMYNSGPSFLLRVIRLASQSVVSRPSWPD